MAEKLGQENAFPLDISSSKMIANGYDSKQFKTGMSKRYLTAKDCLCSMLTNIEFLKANSDTAKCNGKKADEFLVFTAYSLADELLKQENQ